ncbi:hypothetical protein G6O69_37035 [Pseudenhygromyxa sp. WMMC2535]|nr:hypothetical protein [Pseudenhygromyxa sp. WMMC2535]NVB43484.1 hypothetical protein [Pseudenhygromyxa sp. WMMC2535]
MRSSLTRRRHPASALLAWIGRVMVMVIVLFGAGATVFASASERDLIEEGEGGGEGDGEGEGEAIEAIEAERVEARRGRESFLGARLTVAAPPRPVEPRTLAPKTDPPPAPSWQRPRRRPPSNDDDSDDAGC